MNREQKPVSPENLRASDALEGGAAFLIASTFFGSADIHEECQVVFVEHTLVAIKCQSLFSQPLKHCCQGLIMFLLRAPENNDIVRDVLYSTDPLQRLLNYTLKYFRCRR